MMSRIPVRISSFASKPHFVRGFRTTVNRNAEHVKIVEVGPRDGLQNEKSTIKLETKLELIRRLATTGVTHLEAGSFVPAKWVPQVEPSEIMSIYKTLLILLLDGEHR